MSSSQDFAEFVREQIASAGEISYRKMFGEYCFYCNQKTVALVCDNQLFIKPTPIGRELLKSPVEKPPYEGAKKLVFN